MSPVLSGEANTQSHNWEEASPGSLILMSPDFQVIARGPRLTPPHDLAPPDLLLAIDLRHEGC